MVAIVCSLIENLLHFLYDWKDGLGLTPCTVHSAVKYRTTGILRGVNFCPFITQNSSRVTWVLQWLVVDCLQHAMLIPVLVCHLRFHRSCDVLEKVIDYKFKNRFLLQLALTHPSYRWGSAGRHLSACLLCIDVVLASDIWRWLGARETSQSQRGWY
jgi:hypothetical protein